MQHAGPKERVGLPRVEYDRKLREFVDQLGPNPGMGLFGRAAWAIASEREFRELYGVVPIEPPSTARPGSFAEFIRLAEKSTETLIQKSRD